MCDCSVYALATEYHLPLRLKVNDFTENDIEQT
jgi:uncharacterized protein with PIN domain